MSKVCFYRMTHDGGSAPNPFHSWCTLAICTPNHQRARLVAGDFIVGIEGVTLRRKRFRRFGGDADDGRLRMIFVMKVDERMGLHSYFHDTRFADKKAVPASSDPVERVGDNVYFRTDDGKWGWIPGHVHDTGLNIGLQDIRGDTVFVGADFVYFGREPALLPDEFLASVPGRGIKYLRDAAVGARLFEYAQQQAGGRKIVADPIDMKVATRGC